jgi:hypothetical protein
MSYIGRQHIKRLYYWMRKAFIASRGDTESCLQAARQHLSKDRPPRGDEVWFAIMMSPIRNGRKKWHELDAEMQRLFVETFHMEEKSQVRLPNLADDNEVALEQHDLLRRR